ncbi:putative methyl-accepting chemotaxis sensory transducer [Leptothrix cholodnii SP-6]|uniref:Putative methyl-accepting chemotaxis sensory transducer n=1 Tax=Leptothrix cholodnii (strain ATCC 51168 / LMG 8142 / SP-6) TaxID=395495 RepID=B1Y5M2_LEPCP|nr:hypothetical protein [Leptothrix cholodnii]ACB34734.1 putative methyl-accepting chemotaxis sensory transducer [Leptothrix cholodnii SP-6]
MKGMLNFLEKAGLVTRDAPAQPAPPDAPPQAAAPPPPDAAPPVAAAGEAVPMQLDQIYASAGVPPSVYPAERLLRLVDGLGAMDEATRLMAIKAMDAADESWSIDDPLADAAAKVQALARHADGLQHDLQTLESETQARLQAVAARREQVVGDIRRQIAELEALVERELTRSAQETATHEAGLQAARQQTAQQVASLAQTSQRLQGLSRQFGPSAADRKE